MESCVVPDAWQHWLYKTSRQEMAVSVVHWCSMTRRLLWRSLKQPSVLLPGILHEKMPHTARSKDAVWSYSERDPRLWLIRLIKIQTVGNQMAQQVSLFSSLYISRCEVRLSTVLHWVSGVLVMSCVWKANIPFWVRLNALKRLVVLRDNDKERK